MIAKLPYMELINVYFAFFFLFSSDTQTTTMLLYFTATACTHHMACCARIQQQQYSVCRAFECLDFVCLCNPNLVFNYVFFFIFFVQNGVHIFIGSFARWPISIVASYSHGCAVCTQTHHSYSTLVSLKDGNDDLPHRKTGNK